LYESTTFGTRIGVEGSNDGKGAPASRGHVVYFPAIDRPAGNLKGWPGAFGVVSNPKAQDLQSS
jgi:hypothetical protein